MKKKKTLETHGGIGGKVVQSLQRAKREIEAGIESKGESERERKRETD